MHQRIASADVFITHAGEVEVLGFKPPRARDAAAPGEPAAVEPAAVDELLSTQRSPALGTALAGSPVPRSPVPLAEAASATLSLVLGGGALLGLGIGVTARVVRENNASEWNGAT